MLTVLVVDGDPDGREALRRALVEAGFDVVTAFSGADALEAMEDRAPSVVVTQADADAGGMDAATLVGRVRDGRSGTAPAVIVLSAVDSPAAAAATDAGASRVLTGHASVFAVVAAIRAMCDDEPMDDGVGTELAFEGYRGAADRPRRTCVTGSLAALDVAAVAQALAMGGKTGSLVVATPVGEGAAGFDEGRLIHAEFAGEVGDRAFVALVCAAQNGAGDFCFTPVPAAEMARTPRTIHTPVDRLLLTIATGIDEGRLAAGAPR